MADETVVDLKQSAIAEVRGVLSISELGEHDTLN